ncbi:hypothetical protein HYH02_002534 [Chlamydomonas schloesseri]|uniref:Uncharacterized protein n=1 Tax=Chlamydomonas schloesseri TaxID=2026947 RepID=A0A835WV04_9CHLO|nr:hypothetical protein HYH02_002534 [Chlamydomonas schloesseri]|eukprot:KAG2453211.1 hypothetical protein HYH02_002534 [Chlamydomonas schloesseri]
MLVASSSRNLLQNCATCPGGNSPQCQAFFKNCVEITCINFQVTVSLLTGVRNGYQCKSSGTYSWAACVKTDGTRCGTLTSGPCSGPDYCENVGSGANALVYTVNLGTNLVGIQVHDGDLQCKGTEVCSITAPTRANSNRNSGCVGGAGNGCKVSRLRAHVDDSGGGCPRLR